MGCDYPRAGQDNFAQLRARFNATEPQSSHDSGLSLGYLLEHNGSVEETINSACRKQFCPTHEIAPSRTTPPVIKYSSTGNPFSPIV